MRRMEWVQANWRPAGTADALLGAAMAAASGGLLAASLSLHPLWWAAWLAPAPVLAAALAGPPGRGRWLGAVAGIGAGLSTASYYLLVMSPAVVLFLMALRALFWSGGIGLAERAARLLPAPLAVFALPLYAAGLETVLLAFSPHGSAGSLAYSQMAVLPVVQVAALGGVPAVVFLVLCGGSMAGFCIAWLMGGMAGGASIGRACLVAGGVIAVALGRGAVRLHAGAPTQSVDVALVATDRFAGEPTQWDAVWRVYGPAVAGVARPGMTVVLPEKIFRSARADDAVASLSAAAARYQATLVAGIETLDAAGQWVNRAILAAPDGTISQYDKQHLVPGLEARDRPGHADVLIDRGGVRTGLAICKDMHFPQLGRRYGQAGAALMLVPAWDFDRDGWLSDRLSSLRGVESGFAIARTARNGISSVSDRYGRILAEATSSGAVQAVVARVPVESGAGQTLYRRIGDAFGWGALAATVALVVACRLRGPGRRSWARHWLSARAMVLFSPPASQKAPDRPDGAYYTQ